MVIRHFLYGTDHPVIFGDGSADAKLPIRRTAPEIDSESVFTLGDYFSAADDFLNHWVRRADPGLLPACSDETPCLIDVYLEKHGAFYHPSRVVIHGDHASNRFVLNAAVSAEGASMIRREYETLEKLTGGTPFPYLPVPVAIGKGRSYRGGDIPMFLARWFDGFHEFHLTPHGRGQGIIVWHPENGRVMLDPRHVAALYRETAMILASYYNVQTFEQVTDWHHGAGDFIIGFPGDALQLRLVSVRGYAAVLRTETSPDLDAVLAGLLMFLMDLSVWVRLDRLDGVGRLAWSEIAPIPAILNGFYKGLAQNPTWRRLDLPSEEVFRDFVGAWSEKELLDLTEAALTLFHPGRPEAALAKPRLKNHVTGVYRAIYGDLA